MTTLWYQSGASHAAKTVCTPCAQTLSMASNGASEPLPPTWCNNAQSLPELQVRRLIRAGHFTGPGSW